MLFSTKKKKSKEATTSLMETATSPPPPNGCGWCHLHNIIYLWPSTTQHGGKGEVVKQYWQCTGKI